MKSREAQERARGRRPRYLDHLVNRLSAAVFWDVRELQRFLERQHTDDHRLEVLEQGEVGMVLRLAFDGAALRIQARRSWPWHPFYVTSVEAMDGAAAS